MTPKEALLFLKVEEEEDIQEAWDFAFFEWKKQCLSSPLLAKLYLSKIKKVKKIYEAFLILGGEQKTFEISTYNTFSFSNENAIEAFNLFQKTKNDLFKVLWQSEELETFLNALKQLFILRNKYYDLWKVDSVDGEVRISELSDEMQFYAILQNLQLNNLNKIIEIVNKRHELPVVLKNEIERMNKVLLEDPIDELLNLS